MSVDEDYFIPVRGGESGTRVESLSGGTNTSAIEDVEYIQKKLLASLRIPKAFLGFEEVVGEGKNLALLDIRFARTINRIQKSIKETWEMQIMLLRIPEKSKITLKHPRFRAAYDFLLLREKSCLLYTSPSPRDATLSRMPSSA